MIGNTKKPPVMKPASMEMYGGGRHGYQSLTSGTPRRELASPLLRYLPPRPKGSAPLSTYFSREMVTE
jgi:hypothetical protein